MDHNTAIENHTAERYLMGELTEVDRDAYEEHFFSCPACADEIRSANAFMESGRKVVQEEVKTKVPTSDLRRSIWSEWLNWRSLLHPMPATAFALLLAMVGFAGYQNSVTIPRLSQMRKAYLIPNHSVSLVFDDSRGDPQKAPFGKPLDLAIAIPKADNPSMNSTAYQAVIVTDSNVLEFGPFKISQQDARDNVDISLQAGALPVGKYYLVIRGVNSSGAQNSEKGEPLRIPFEISDQE
jgi:hypothetical protein